MKAPMGLTMDVRAKAINDKASAAPAPRPEKYTLGQTNPAARPAMKKSKFSNAVPALDTKVTLTISRTETSVCPV
jgi:hypothetical protein